MKGSYLDVRVRDQRGRSYIVEMQVLNVEGFEKRVLYNACKAYVSQLQQGDDYPILTDVVAVTVTDFTMFPELERVISRFRLRAEENPLISHQDLELVFAELPKFTKSESELETALDRWLTFLKTAKDLKAIPHSLAVEPAIVQAFEKANRAAWSYEELDAQEKREFWIFDQRTMADRAARKAAQIAAKAAAEKAHAEGLAAGHAQGMAQGIAQGVAQGMAQGMAQGVAQGVAQGIAQGMAQGMAEMLISLLRRRFPTLSDDVEARVRNADSAQLVQWTERFVDAQDLDEVFR
jgi:predicted transposase/invertase (TIGR01784 family)